MARHELKTDPEPFQAIIEGRKRHETRRDVDRGFELGDVLVLRETQHTGESMALGAPLVYTGREVEAFVTHVTKGPHYGLHADVAVMSLAVVNVNTAGQGM